MADLVTDDTLADVLLPGNSLLYEEASLQAMIEAWPLDIAAIERERDPMRCRIANLIFLFFQRGGTWWNDSWIEAKKRAYVRDLLVYKRLEGTMLGVELYANLEGALVMREELPPGRVAAVKPDGLSHAAELALMPQLRLYHDLAGDPLARVAAAATPWRFVAGRNAAMRDRARPIPRRAVIFEPRTGTETPIDVVNVASDGRTALLAQPGTRGQAMVAGWSVAGRCTASKPNMPAPIVVDLADPAMETVVPVLPLRRQAAAAAAGKVVGRIFACAAPTSAGTYDRLYLKDPSRIAPGSGVMGRAFVAGQRIAVAPYTAFLEMYVPGSRPTFRGREMVAGRFSAVGRDLASLHAAMGAMEAARRPGDALYVTLSGKRAGARPSPIPAIGDLAA